MVQLACLWYRLQHTFVTVFLLALYPGIGGSYMCIYPMDSPGGYQLVGRTLPIWNTFGRSGPFTADKPWLLEFFDQVSTCQGNCHLLAQLFYCSWLLVMHIWIQFTVGCS